MHLARWKVLDDRSYEDQLLLAYWQQVGGLIFAEVTVGKGGMRQYPPGAKPRRIDGVRIISTPAAPVVPDLITFNNRLNGHEFEYLVTGAELEVIEVKYDLERCVIGQVMVGADLMELEYQPARVAQVIVCEEGDPVLERVCEKRAIRLWMPPRSTR